MEAVGEPATCAYVHGVCGRQWRIQVLHGARNIFAGSELAADGLTKALGGQAHRRFLQLLGMTSPEVKDVGRDGRARVQVLRGHDHGQRLYLSMRRRHWRVLGPR